MLVIMAAVGRGFCVAIGLGWGEGSGGRVASAVGVGGDVGEGLAKAIVGLGGARGVATCACRHPVSVKMANVRVDARKSFVIEAPCLGVMELFYLASEA